MCAQTLALDFGTSNTAAAVLDRGVVRPLPMEGDATTLPTAVFFPTEGGGMRFGTDAATALIEGEEGRYMRALKSVLGLPLLHEERMIGGGRQTIGDVITRFLLEIRKRAEARAGTRFTAVLSGRPVHFHTRDSARDAQAQSDLTGCYHAAGFDEVAFLAEPEAAVWAAQDMGQVGTLGLIIDIGGGTSDFSVFRTRAGQPEILANHGIRLGGTDFDRTLALAEAMPALGFGGQLRRAMGDGLLPVPHAIYADLATWAKIPFLYTPETRRMVADMVKYAVEPDKLRRLDTVLDLELGHELAFAVERGKIAANEGNGVIDMTMIEPGLHRHIAADALHQALLNNRTELRGAAFEALSQAGVEGAQVGTVILVGGSSLMRFVGDVAQELCPNAALQRGSAFTAIIDGLALASGERTS